MTTTRTMHFITRLHEYNPIVILSRGWLSSDDILESGTTLENAITDIVPAEAVGYLGAIRHALRCIRHEYFSIDLEKHYRAVVRLNCVDTFKAVTVEKMTQRFQHVPRAVIEDRVHGSTAKAHRVINIDGMECRVLSFKLWEPPRVKVDKLLGLYLSAGLELLSFRRRLKETNDAPMAYYYDTKDKDLMEQFIAKTQHMPDNAIVVSPDGFNDVVELHADNAVRFLREDAAEAVRPYVAAEIKNLRSDSVFIVGSTTIYVLDIYKGEQND